MFTAPFLSRSNAAWLSMNAERRLRYPEHVQDVGLPVAVDVDDLLVVGTVVAVGVDGVGVGAPAAHLNVIR